MIVSINQPAYLPWLGYYHRIANSDLHIVLDDVQFEKNSFTNRNKIRTRDGWCWLTVPVQTRAKFRDLPIDRLEIAPNTNWRRKHWDSIKFGYAGAPFFSLHAAFLAGVYAREWTRLLPLIQDMNDYMLEALRISTPLVMSSAIKVPGKKQELILNLCQAVGASVYLSGPLGRDYLVEDEFRHAGIDVLYHEYRHPTFVQVHGGFEPHMAAFDLLLNHGPESARILGQGQEGGP
ncbi:MAG: WbqC family protein [Pseudomonadota bacterium]